MPWDDDDFDDSPGGGPISPIQVAIGIAVGLVILVAVISIAPGIGTQVESAAPAPGVSSTWNNTCRSATGAALMPVGSAFFASNLGLVILLVVVSIIGLALAFLISAPRRREYR